MDDEKLALGRRAYDLSASLSGLDLKRFTEPDMRAVGQHVLEMGIEVAFCLARDLIEQAEDRVSSGMVATHRLLVHQSLPLDEVD